MTPGLHYSKEFEAAVLGICLLEKSAFGRTYGLIDEKVFYQQDNKVIYSCLKEMYDKSIPIDLLTVWNRLIESGVELICKNSVTTNPSAGIAYYLTRLTNEVVSSAHLEYHCHVLKKMWQKRELETITRSGIDPTGNERTQAFEINARIQEILGDEIKKDWHSMDELMFDLFKHQEQLRTGEKQFVPTGFKLIDRLNGGFSAGQLIIIGARPSVGKSALMNKIAFTAAAKEKTVGIVSLEMDNTQIAARLASIDTQTSFGTIYRDLFNDENERKTYYDRISKHTINYPIFVTDKTKVDVNEIKAKAIKLKHQKGLDILFVDYLQLVDSPVNKNYMREQEVARISRGMKLLAMELEIPVVVLCQLNRSVTSRKGKDRYPQLSDLRESGAIEQDADIVMMLHRDWMSGYEVHPDTGNSTEFDADLLGVKWRNGATFHLGLDFNPPLMKFSEKGSSLTPVHIAKDEEDLF